MRRVGPLLKSRKFGPFALAVLLFGTPIAALSAELAMLDSLAKGAWSLRIRDDGSERRICVRDGR